MQSRLRSSTVWLCAISIVGCTVAPPPRLDPTTVLPAVLPADASPPKPGSSSKLLQVSPSDIAVLEQRFPGIGTCIAIVNLPSRQDFPVLFNYALSAVPNDRKANGLLQDVRSSFLRVDSAARTDTQTLEGFNPPVRAVELLDSVVRARGEYSQGFIGAAAVLRQNPLVDGVNLRLSGGEVCVDALKTRFGREAAGLARAWQSFQVHVQEQAARGDQGARAAFVIATAPSLEWLNQQLVAARSRSNAAQAATLLGILAIGALAAYGLSASSDTSPRELDSISRNDILRCEDAWGGVNVVLRDQRRIFVPFEHKSKYCY